MMAHEFELVRRILKEHSGLNLGKDKQDLLEGKLRPLMREFGYPSLSHLVLAMMKPDAHRLRSRAAQAVTVQESYFFRDKVPFHYFVDVMLPKLMARRQAERRIRVWCAAASVGQEPYSLAMELAEVNGRFAGWSFEIVATDFVEEALAKARKGVYSQFEVQRGLPVSLLVKHFNKTDRGWELSPGIRGKVEFRTHNLLDDCQGLGRFDVIFCRNVLIYFDEATRRAVLSRLAARLVPDGYLVLGAAETTSGVSAEFMPVPEGHHGLFCFTPQAAAAAKVSQRRAAGQGR
jgi:chemotaxis protein methyltransferase CheR